MEQAVNTFTKGLQLDTNPMIQGNDSLTDCLNGTIVTMNGNEMILQNDMGNRRVDNAFLPSGYQPVGMKEYGGIIYVAAYNPITNKSQIGSFPSPQKRINSLNTIGMGGVFDFNKFFSNSNTTIDSDLFNIKVINSDSFMIPLTKDVSLRAGDKFVIYSSDIENLKNNISNYDNTISDENGVKYVKSPKNKKYTLQLGILNSQNEFVDITKTLCRWEQKDNKSVPKIYDQSYSDLYKFNDGYFIAQSFDNDNLEYTENDAKLIINRQTLPANTYSYKLIGPLYLKVILNHIQNFNYNIYGYKEGNRTLLTIEGFITYNCPDGVNFKKSPVGEYYTLDEGEVNNFQSFDLYNSDGKMSGTEQGQKECEYLPELNQYRVKIVKDYEIGQTKGIFNYVIGVNADTTRNNNIYIKELSSKGSLNLDLLGTGTLQYNGWKFYNNQEETTLTFSLEAYPKYEESFEDLWFEFIDITKSQSSNPNNPRFPQDSYLPVYNGRQTYTFDWNIIGLESRKVYKVITHYKSGNNSKFNDESIDDNRWLLTTSLFNEFYPSSTGISDFSTTQNQEFLDKMKIKLKVEDNLRTDFPEETSFEGALVGQNRTISYSCKHTVGINITSNPTLKIVDEELYPDFITIKDSYKNDVKINNPTIKIGSKPTDKNNIIKDFKEQLSVIKNGTVSASTQGEFDGFTVIDYESLNVNSNTITGEISYYDVYKSDGDTGFEVNNVFGDVQNLIDDAYKIEHYGGIQVNNDPRGGHRDGHFVDIYINESNKIIYLPSNDTIGYNGHRVFSESADSHVTIKFSDIYSLIFDVFNLTVDKSQMFLYVFPDGNTYNNDIRNNYPGKIFTFINNAYENNNVEDATGDKYALLWWRTSDNSWALFKNMIKYNDNNENIKFQIVNLFNPSLDEKHYCMYNNYQIDDKFAATNNNMYYDEYSVPLSILINYSIQGNIQNIISITENIEFGNLNFEAKSEIEDNNQVSLKLTSSETFNNNILSFNRNSIYSMDLKTGLMYDSLGRNLDPNYIYKYDTEKKQLVRINNTYMQVDFEHKINDKNTLVYNRSTPGIPMFRYQQLGSKDDFTTLDYESANIVQGI